MKPSLLRRHGSAATRVRFAALLRIVGLALLAAFAQNPLCTGETKSPLDATAAPSFQTRSVSRTLHLIVGRSLFLNSSAKLKRIYIGNPNVLESYTAGVHEALVTAKSAGISSVVLWDDLGRSQAYIVSADLDVEGLRHAIASALPQDRIEVTAAEGKINLSGSVVEQDDAGLAQKLAAVYSKDVTDSLTVRQTHLKEVRLKVRMLEIDRSKLAQFGIDFLSGGKNAASASTRQFASFGGFAVGNTPPAASQTGIAVADPLNLFLYNQQFNVGVAIADLEKKQILQILAEPTITAISGQKASFLSGGEFPFPVVQGGGGNFTSVTVQFRPYGVKLDFTPIVNPDGTIRLKVAPEVSALDYTNEVVVSGYTIPALSTRRAETDVELRSGQSFAISGLLDHRLTDAFSRMPGIDSVPVLGKLFRSWDKRSSVVELVVIVTPTIVNPLTDFRPPAEPRLSKPNLDADEFDKEVEHGHLKRH